jgi:hypothetical protein
MDPGSDWSPGSDVSLYLPTEQQVFPGAGAYGKYLRGASKLSEIRHGVYREVGGGVERQVFVSFKPDLMDLRIGGILDGKLIIDAFGAR